MALCYGLRAASFRARHLAYGRGYLHSTGQRGQSSAGTT
jgi:hypothetical protein